MSLDLERIEERERFRFYSLNRSEKRKVVKKIIDVISERSEIVLAIIYGSFIRDYPFRDIDLAVYVSNRVDPLKYKIELDRVLSDSIGYPFDTHVLNYAPPWFTKEVIENGQVILEKKPLLDIILYKRAIEENESIEFKKTLLNLKL